MPTSIPAIKIEETKDEKINLGSKRGRRNSSQPILIIMTLWICVINIPDRINDRIFMMNNDVTFSGLFVYTDKVSKEQ